MYFVWAVALPPTGLIIWENVTPAYDEGSLLLTGLLEDKMNPQIILFIFLQVISIMELMRIIVLQDILLVVFLKQIILL